MVRFCLKSYVEYSFTVNGSLKPASYIRFILLHRNATRFANMSKSTKGRVTLARTVRCGSFNARTCYVTSDVTRARGPTLVRNVRVVLPIREPATHI